MELKRAEANQSSKFLPCTFIGIAIINTYLTEREIFKQLATLEIKIPRFYFLIKEGEGGGNSI